MFVHSPNDLAVYLTDRRKKLKLSQTELGQRVGLKQQTVSQFEVKPQRTELATFFRILSALDLDIQILPKEAKEGHDKTEWKEEW